MQQTRASADQVAELRLVDSLRDISATKGADRVRHFVRSERKLVFTACDLSVTICSKFRLGQLHTMMVSYVSGGTPYLTYHTSNRYRRSMNQVLADWGNAYYYAGRT
jgi:hypothetical protein